jgi:hypothetical protein
MNHSKRDIERKVENLDDGEGDGGPPRVLIMTHIGDWENGNRPTIDDSPHPKLTVKPWPEQKPNSLKIATPKVIPEPWCYESTLFVHTCENGEKYLFDRNLEESNTVAACQLWEGLDEADLREDVKIRQENDDPIPPFLEGYATE